MLTAGRTEGDRVQRAARRSRSAGRCCRSSTSRCCRCSSPAPTGRLRSRRAASAPTGSSASCSRRAAIRSRPSRASRSRGIDDAERAARRRGLSRRDRAARWPARHRRRPRADRRRPWRRFRGGDRARVRRRRCRSRSTACSTGATSDASAAIGSLTIEVARLKYSIITFGCRVNQADSLGFEEELLARGRASRAAPSDADLVVVNTCSVTATADQGARQTIRRVARDNPARADRRHRLLRDAAARTRSRALPNVVRVVPNDDKPRLIRAARDGPRSLDDRRAVRRRRRQLRRADRAWRRGPDRVHAARADRLRRAVLVLHHPDDARRAAERADRRRAARSRARRRGRLQGDRADRRAPRLVRPRPDAARRR